MMLELRRRLAMFCGKIAGAIVRRIGKGRGSVLPGHVARLIAPDILSYMADKFQGKIIVTMGTNGKTTVNSMIYHALEAEGKKVIANRAGANMLNGVVAAFVQAAKRGGKLDADYACIEVDEFASTQILPRLKPDCVLLTNLFRDQIDRFGEIDTIRDRIKAAISSVPKAVFVSNCDDFISYTLALECGNPVVAYGINERIFDGISSSEVRESTFCRYCGAKLEYDFFHYGQLGIYHCPSCGWERPAPDYTAEEISLQETGYAFSIDGIPIRSRASAAYSVYNTLAAYTALRVSDAPTGRFRQTIEEFNYGNNREGTFAVNGSRVHLHLVKNPVGFQQKISLVMKDAAPKDIIIQINDNFQDGTDISWLWDVDFLYLRDANAASITVTGIRRLDMALRLKYEDIACEPAQDLEKAVRELSVNGTGNIYMIVNYTGLFPANQMLRKMQAASEKGRKRGQSK